MKTLPVRTLFRSTFRGGATRMLAIHHQVVEWQLAQARFAERQISTSFELYRTALLAGRRFTEVFAGTLGAELPHHDPPASA